ncbi:MAG: hypothetical protein RI909_2074 [Bacteroidota bacterium]|jgi:VanZ family protein
MMTNKPKGLLVIMKDNLTWRRTFALLVVCIIFAGSSVPGKSIPHVFSLTPDKLIHCLEYGVLGFFLFRWLQVEFSTLPQKKVSLLTVLIGSLIGVADENYQRLTPGRTSDFRDWIIDSIGIILAVVFMNYLAKRKSIK